MKDNYLDVKLYQSWKGGLKLVAISLIFVALGVGLLLDHVGLYGTIVAYGSLVMGALGMLTGMGQIALRLCGVPLVAISNDRISTLVLIKFRYDSLMLSDVKAFHLRKINDVSIIYAEMSADNSMRPTMIGSHLFSQVTVNEVFTLLNSTVKQSDKA